MLMDIWVVCSLWLSRVKLIIAFVCESFYGHIFLSSWVNT